MMRQRVKLRTPLLAWVVRVLTLALALALVWYGLMAVLLAVKVSSHTVNGLSGYRSLFHDVAGLRPANFDTAVRLIAGIAGFIAFLVFLYLAVQELPRPYLTRSTVELLASDRGATTVRARAVERVAERAAQGNADVTAAAGRLGIGELDVGIGVRRASAVAEALRDVRSRVIEDLGRHELPEVRVNVTVVNYKGTKRRELT
jgi:hypothetical protein